MKHFRAYFLMSLSIFMTTALIALADPTAVPSAVPVVTDPNVVSNDVFFTLLFNSIGQFKGASALAVVVIVTQLLMTFFKTQMAAFAGKWKLLIVSFLGIVGSVVGLMMTGVSFTTALLSGATITAFQVFGNQLWKQWTESKAKVPSPTTTSGK